MAEAARNDERTVRELSVPAEESQLARVRDFIVEVCEAAGFTERETSNTKLAVDEACTNIVKHAYEGRPRGNIDIRAEIEPGAVHIRLHDTGKRFDFASVKDPDLDHYVETGRKGGLGVYLINRLMDGVEYRSGGDGNELVLTKKSRSALAVPTLGEGQPLRQTLRFKFTLRAGAGFFVLLAVVYAFVIVRQTRDIQAQRVVRWTEKARVARTLASRSVDALVRDDEFSLERTNLAADLARMVESGDDIAWARVVDAQGQIVASSDIDEIFTRWTPEGAQRLPGGDDRVTWMRMEVGGRSVRDIAVRVDLPGGQGERALGQIHLGVWEDAVEAAIEDNRVQTTLLFVGIFVAGLVLIMGLVRVFVRPIQVLTDGVRAIGDGTFDRKLEIDGPAEIGAIASVFNEITDKFRRAQDTLLEQEKLHKEMEVAKEIQHSLLPRRKPEVSGYDIAPLYRAAAEVGGDYYDFVEVDDDTIGVVVADVSGKGVPGSLVMTMIRTALRMEARGNKNASDVMAKMNAFVTDDMKKGMFVTMFYVILDSKNRIISYASAGHNPMILYRHETRETYFLNPRGFPVGISLPDEDLFRKSISLEKIKLKKDDMLVIYTDGVTEAMNERREQYGEERLLALIREHGHRSPEEFIQKLDEDIQRFTAGHPQNDDITVVAIKEKLTADDVLFGIRKRLIEMVDVEGMSVREACARMKVSPSTYYRYKRRLETMGERGLRNKVLRQEEQLRRLSVEGRQRLLGIIAKHPEYGAKRLTEEFNRDRPAEHHVTERIIYDELRRLNLNTRELRMDYLRRNRLIPPEEEAAQARDEVEALLGEGDATGEAPAVATPEAGDDAGADAGAGVPPDGDLSDVIEAVDDGEAAVGARDDAATDAGAADASEVVDDVLEADGVAVRSVRHPDDVVEIRVAGHLDSVSSQGLERRLREVVAAGASRVVVNLAGVSYISSGGWGIFTGEVRTLRRRGGDIVLCGLTPDVYDVYELLGFADVLRAFGTVDDARAYLALPAGEREAVAEAVARDAHSDDVGLEPPGADAEPVDFAGHWESLGIEATTVGEAGDIAVLSLRGIIDTVSAERLREAIARVIDSGIHKIVVDMSQVEYVSSGGWGTFTERLREVRRAGGDIKLFGMDPDVYYVFTMLGFNIVLSSFDILAEAIDDFAREQDADRPVLPPGGPDDAAARGAGGPTIGDAGAGGPAIDDAGGRADALDAFDSPPAAPGPHGDAGSGERDAAAPTRDAFDGASAPAPPGAPRDLDDIELPASRADAEVIEWRVERGIVVGVLHGAVEASASDVIDRSMGPVLATRPRAVVFDLSDVSYMSSTGWGRFAACVEAMRAWNGRVALCGMNEALHEVYACLEFREFLPAYGTRSEAVAAMRGGESPMPAAATGAPSPTGDADVPSSPASAPPAEPAADAARGAPATPVDDPAWPADAPGAPSPGRPVPEAELDAILGGAPDASDATPSAGDGGRERGGAWDAPWPDAPAPSADEASPPRADAPTRADGPPAADAPPRVDGPPAGDAPPRADAPPRVDAPPADEAWAPEGEPARPRPLADDAPSGAEPIDVGRARDATSDADRNLRTLGWKAYGERLRRKRSKKAEDE